MRVQYKGISAYAMLHKDFPIRKFNKAFPPDGKNMAVAVLANRFGKRWSNLGLWVQSQKGDHAIEVFFMSGPARRNESGGPFDLWPDYSVADLNSALERNRLPHLAERIAAFRDSLEAIVKPETKVFICPELEDNLTDLAFKKLLRAFRSGFNGSSIKPVWVRNPVNEGAKIPPKVIKEVHGVSRQFGDIYNPDGISVDFKDGENYFETMSLNQLRGLWDRHCTAKIRFVWAAHMQGVGNAGSFAYPPINKRKYVVTDEAIAYCRELLRP